MPVEALAIGTTVIAINNGGPKETIVDRETGFLLEDDAEEWANRMDELEKDVSMRLRFEDNGKLNVKGRFGLPRFEREIREIV